MKRFLFQFLLINLLIVACGSAGVSPTQLTTPPSMASQTDTKAFTPTWTLTYTFSLTPPPSFTIMVREEDGMVMVLVPEGEFGMGSSMGKSSEKPHHSVFLDSYWIDQTEITNGMYKRCVEAGICKRPSSDASMSALDYYTNPGYDLFPVVFVDWNDATTYCNWVKGRLPTEAEWEKAARDSDSRLYPWGNESPDCSRANFQDKEKMCLGDTMAVGTYFGGTSLLGAMDMAGNVSEWVADWFWYYPESGRRQENPTGPESGEARVIRGGSFLSEAGDILSYKRSWTFPTTTSHTIGFRCALSTP